MDLKPYVCKCCGGRVNVAKMLCEYCGTQYHDDSLKRIVISAVKPGEAKLRAEVRIDYDHMLADPESARDYALGELRRQLADGLLAYMKIETCKDFGMDFSRKEIIRGEVRVIDPMFEDRY